MYDNIESWCFCYNPLGKIKKAIQNAFICEEEKMDPVLIAEAAAAGNNSDFARMGLAIGAGLAVTGVGGPAIGVGLAASKALEGMARQPEATGRLLANTLIFAALAEALGLFAFLIGILLFLQLQ